MELTEEQLNELHSGEFNGICTECRSIKFGDTEPDARGYHCENCDAMAVIGAEEAMF